MPRQYNNFMIYIYVTRIIIKISLIETVYTTCIQIRELNLKSEVVIIAMKNKKIKLKYVF